MRENEIYSGSGIEGYEDIIYGLLKLAMYINFRNTTISELKLKKIQTYCDLIINYQGIPYEVKNAICMIKKDYEYLKITENINYFYKNYLELKDNVEYLNNIYINDIIEDMKKKVKPTIYEKDNIKKIIEIIKNKENVLDETLVKIFYECSFN